MKSAICFALFLLFSFSARADLLERFHIEEALQGRLQDIMKIYDSSAKVLVHVDYHNYEGALPGTNVGDSEKVSPDHIESVDIAKVNVDIYTTLSDIPEEANAAIKSALPVNDKKAIEVKIHKYDGEHVNVSAKPTPVEIKDLADIVHDTVNDAAEIFGVIFGAIMLLFFGFMHIQSSRRMREMKEQIKILAAAIGESGGGRTAPTPQAKAVAAAGENAPAGASSVDHPFENWSVKSLRELIADAYWCERDGYANWLWRELSSAQKYELLNDMAFLKEYSASFVDGPVVPGNFHEHPYYLEPQELATLSQKDLGEAVKKDIGLWHAISPMRKQYLPFSLQEKMKAVQAKVSTSAPKFPHGKSSLRALQTKPSWGDLSNADEALLFSQPDMVPIQMRKHIRTLVWLAKRDGEQLRQILSRYDARSLASAWVGPEDVLKVLESGLPEKKLKLLHTYKSKMEPSRNSDIYQMLVEEGLNEEAA